ncbi:NAD(P) transhydrogenase subunit alpha [Holospora obtusa F1]|uniref:proton-translocating NAD(P)(+) transhydrogenase n=1 Tax=Holospora obtusa F1 TaxID=1399147 RepID=W6TDV3_HOLOB|nr:proton-translocating transhydrogenase family protein [Holospora obtusa]ETZ06779.1 NAD(P) transhydrogenase subunit alpha [Holospora obtusa F1]
MDFFLILMIGIILGYYTVCRVPSIFHAPLMSLTNGVSSICILILLDESVKSTITGSYHSVFKILSCMTVMMLCLNISGGFDITKKMLSFFYIPAKQESANQGHVSISITQRWGAFFFASMGTFMSIALFIFLINKVRVYLGFNLL